MREGKELENTDHTFLKLSEGKIFIVFGLKIGYLYNANKTVTFNHTHFVVQKYHSTHFTQKYVIKCNQFIISPFLYNCIMYLFHLGRLSFCVVTGCKRNIDIFHFRLFPLQWRSGMINSTSTCLTSSVVGVGIGWGH